MEKEKEEGVNCAGGGGGSVGGLTDRRLLRCSLW